MLLVSKQSYVVCMDSRKKLILNQCRGQLLAYASIANVFYYQIETILFLLLSRIKFMILLDVNHFECLLDRNQRRWNFHPPNAQRGALLVQSIMCIENF